MTVKISVSLLKAKYRGLRRFLNERARRRWAATEARALGRGGVTLLWRATGISRGTIHAGLRELRVPSKMSHERLRRPGGGRKTLIETDPDLNQALDVLIDPATRGDPVSSLRWTSLSTPHLAKALTQKGHPVSQRSVCSLLHRQGYSLQANRKTREGGSHPDRDAQFRHISDAVGDFQKRDQPVISVDTKKKELVGDFKNPGREWRPKDNPETVRVHDFVDPQLGKVIPYGVYDLARNEGWVNVGISHDTAAFAVASIRRWWKRLGRRRYPRAREVLITADCGGSNGYRPRLWKTELQRFADDFGLAVHVHHFPPGTSKWNKIEHRMFSFISQNWRGRPLVTRAAVVDLIAGTQTAQGLKVYATLDTTDYPAGQIVSDLELKSLRLIPETFHGDWNYRIEPRNK